MVRYAGAMDPIELLRLLVDPTRLAIVGAVATAPGDTAELAERSGRSTDEVLRTVGALVQAGLVVHEGGGYHLDVAAWRDLARDLPQDAAASPRIAFGMTEDEAEILARFFRGDRLVEIPAQHAKRRIVLERLALEFEPGVRYGGGGQRGAPALPRRSCDAATAARRRRAGRPGGRAVLARRRPPRLTPRCLARPPPRPDRRCGGPLWWVMGDVATAIRRNRTHRVAIRPRGPRT